MLNLFLGIICFSQGQSGVPHSDSKLADRKNYTHIVTDCLITIYWIICVYILIELLMENHSTFSSLQSTYSEFILNIGSYKASVFCLLQLRHQMPASFPCSSVSFLRTIRLLFRTPVSQDVSQTDQNSSCLKKICLVL